MKVFSIAQSWPWDSQSVYKKWWHFFESLFFFIVFVCYYFIFHHKKLSKIVKNVFISPKMFLFCQAFKFLRFSFLPKALWFQEKVGNELIMTSWNGLHKLPITISEKTPKPLSVFSWRHENGEIMDQYIWQLEKGLIISSLPFLLRITNF